MNVPLLNLLVPRRRKQVIWAFWIVFSYTVIGFLILPPIIRAMAVKQLSKQLDREVTIEKVKLNPYTLSATVRGLLIKDKDGEPFVSWDEVYVNFQLSSFFGHAWVFKEISTIKPFFRVQMNKDYTFNFSDLIAKFSTNTPAAKPAVPAAPSKPLALRIDKLQITGASASLADLTPRTPFKRIVGPLNVTMMNFETDPGNKNPYSFTGTTDAGEKLSWSGYFYLDPLRSQGELSLENLSLNKYAPLYQDLVRFEIKGGVIGLRSTYEFELSSSNHVASVTNSSFSLRSFKLADGSNDIAELPEFAVSGVSMDLVGRKAEVGSITVANGRFLLLRGKDKAVNVVELSKPAENATNAPGGILFLLRSVTNAVAMLLNSTNSWQGAIDDVDITNCALSLEDLANSRPVRLNLDEISLTARHISNVPGTNLTAALSLRWNTNGTIRTDVQASFSPPTADIQLALDKLELRPLDPYLESQLNLFILDSKLSLDGRVRLRTQQAALPEVTFKGDTSLDDFATVDGVYGEDLLKWGSVRMSGIDASLNPPKVTIKEIAVDDAFAHVVIETNHTVNLLAALRMGTTNATESESPEEKLPKKPGKPVKTVATQESPAAKSNAAASSLPDISVNNVVISNSAVHFNDLSITPPVNLSIQKMGGTIAGISTADLQHADVNLHASVDNVGPVEITGTINPFRENLTNEIRIVVTNVDLTPTSPYVGKFAGYRLARGKLDLNLSYHLHNRQLKSENLIELDQFTFGEKVNSPDATKLPVRLAIAILKDRDGKIKLDVPIEGSLDDPKFKFNKVIVHALLNILTKIATSPFSALGAVFGGKAEELNYQEFTAGSSELQPAGKAKLDSLLKGLYERPALQVNIEGSVDPDADREGLRRAALEQRLRTMEWNSLRKSERATTTADRITLTPGQRTHWLKKAYAGALEKHEIIFPSPTNSPSSQTVSQTGLAHTSPTVRNSAAGMEKGAQVLMLMAANPPSTTSAPPRTAVRQPPLKRNKADAMEDALLDSISISDNDFQALATARAKAVREYVLQSGQVGADRIFLTESQPGGVKTQGSRAYLQLQ